MKTIKIDMSDVRTEGEPPPNPNEVYMLEVVLPDRILAVAIRNPQLEMSNRGRVSFVAET